MFISPCKVDVHISVLDIKNTFIEWCMVRCESKNGHPKNKCWKKIGVHAQILLTILEITINITELGGGPI